jgi:hypothetical protein
MYTGLSARRTYIVFLKGSSSPYRFADLQTGAMIVPARTPAVAYGSKPVDRLLAELVSAARIGDEAMRRVAVEQLGKLGDIRAAAVLRELSKSKDLARRTSALVARIEVGDAPAEADLLAILRMDPASSKSRVGMSTGVAGPFFAGAEQVQIVQAISRSVKPSGSFTGRAAKQLNGFDYIDFVTQTLSYKVIKEHDILRSDLVGTLRDLGDPKSMPLLLKLLNDHSKAVRYMAATSFAVLAKNNKWYVAGDIFNKNEAKYIKQCREWAKQHPGGI